MVLNHHLRIASFIILLGSLFLLTHCSGNNKTNYLTKTEETLTITKIEPELNAYKYGDSITVNADRDCSECTVLLNGVPLATIDYAKNATNTSKEISNMKYPIIQLPFDVCNTDQKTCTKQLSLLLDGSHSKNAATITIVNADFSDSCAEGQLVVNGICTDVTCDDIQCATNEYCEQGKCIAKKECIQNIDCNSDQICSSIGNCVKKIEELPCDKDNECAVNQACVSGKCQAKVVKENIKPTYSCKLSNGDQCVSGFSCQNGSCQKKSAIPEKIGSYCTKDDHCTSSYCKINKTIQVGDIAGKPSGYYEDPYGVCTEKEVKYNGWELTIAFTAAVMATAETCDAESYKYSKETDANTTCTKFAPSESLEECRQNFTEVWNDTVKKEGLCNNFEKKSPSISAEQGIKYCSSHKECSEAYQEEIDNFKTQETIPQCIDEPYITNIAESVLKKINQSNNTELKKDIISDLINDAQAHKINYQSNCEHYIFEEYKKTLHELAPVGYEKGTKITHLCEPGYAVTKVNARVGSIVDQISLACTPFNTISQGNDYTKKIVSNSGKEISAGGSGGTPYSYKAPSKKVINGFWLKACPNGNWPETICEMDMYSIAVYQASGEFFLNNNNIEISSVSWGDGNGGIEATITKCPAHEVLVGINTYSNNAVKSIQPICMDIEDIDTFSAHLTGDTILKGI